MSNAVGLNTAPGERAFLNGDSPLPQSLPLPCSGGAQTLPAKGFPTRYTGFTDDAMEALLNEYLPPGFRAYRDDWVEVGFRAETPIRRSLGKYGFVPAARFACMVAWRHWEDQGTPRCPSVGLMPVAPGSNIGAAQGGDAGARSDSS